MEIENDEQHAKAIEKLSQIMDELDELSKKIETYETKRWPDERTD